MGKSSSIQAQPFNIGKYSTVSKAKISDLALSDEDFKPSTRKAKAAKGKGKITPSPSTVATPVEGSDDEEFAMDSQEEEAQLKEAFLASEASFAAKGKEKAKKKAITRPNNLRDGAGGQKAKALAPRTTVARAAESQFSIYQSLG